MRSCGDPLSPQITGLECRYRHALSWVTLPQGRRPWMWLPLTLLCSADSRRVCDAKGPLLRHVNSTEYSAECDSTPAALLVVAPGPSDDMPWLGCARGTGGPFPAALPRFLQRCWP